MELIDNYIEKLFSDPGFGVILAIFSIWYSFYLFRKPPAQGAVLFLSMTNSRKKSPRKTTLIIINNSGKDIQHSDVVVNHPICLNFSKAVNIHEINIRYNSFSEGNLQILNKHFNKYYLEFDLLKNLQEIHLEILNDSSKHQDLTWQEFQIEGIIKNTSIYRDDFSDQMTHRATSIEFESYIGAILLALVFAFTIKTILKPLNVSIPYSFLLGVSFVLSYFLSFKYFASRVGHKEYKWMWRVIRKSEKSIH